MDLLDELHTLIAPILDDLNVELVELQFNRSKRSSLRIFVWQEGGISVDRITEISRKVADVLDRKDVIPGKYVLEVSSPGIDRPLKTQRDFERQLNRKVRIIVNEDGKQKTYEGHIQDVKEDQVTLNVKDNLKPINVHEIVSAKIMVEF